MSTRPTSISVISWILIAIAAIASISTTAMIGNPAMTEVMSKSPLPISVQYAVSYIGLIIMFVSGVAMLKGRGWGRALYVGWNIISIVLGAATSPMKTAMIPGVVVFLIVAFFLFRPNASEYFSASGTVEDAQSA